MNHTFTLILVGPNPNEPTNLIKLFEAGCSDALFGERSGLYIANFDREASSFSEALMSAVRNIENAVSGLKVVRVEIK